MGKIVGVTCKVDVSVKRFKDREASTPQIVHEIVRIGVW